ncbi:MAG: arginine--tRNA ligase [Candidatus Caenarcaniphilales bacterium]|nr:arginine--tRNA ligase [Candidatus Caenarcaniphilales bacterium]
MLNLLALRIQYALQELYKLDHPVKVSIPSKKAYGDLCCTVPLALSKTLSQSPLKIAETLQHFLSEEAEGLYETTVVAPGFLNFHLSPSSWQAILKGLCQGELLSKTNQLVPLLIEYVSANPTGDLHLGHGRGAVLGSTLAKIWRELGRSVATEFYLNDAGEQIQKLGRSAWNIYTSKPTGKPTGKTNSSDDYPPELISPYLEALEAGEYDLASLTEIVKTRIISEQKKVLSGLKVDFDCWISEKTDLHKTGKLADTLKLLEAADLTYEKDGALWLASTQLGDERDRVLLKSLEGDQTERKPTYLAGDIAYHLHKFERYPALINLWGADHQGQDISLKLALKALGYDENQLQIIFLQLVSLMEKGKEVRMSKRAGTVITIEEVVERVGSDAFRLSMLLSHANHRLIFDLDLAQRQDEQNPVFYLQYSHARACGILRHASEESHFDGTMNELALKFKEISFDQIGLIIAEDLETEEKEATCDLLIRLLFFDSEVHNAAETSNPSQIVHYLIELARLFHSFYGHCRVVQKDKLALSLARLRLVDAFRRIMHKGLDLLLVSAPERM